MTSEPTYDPSRTGSWLVCSTCGTQFPTSDQKAIKTCFICDDPRQYTPPSGQSFTNLEAIRSSHKNVFRPLPGSSNASDTDLISIVTEPKIAIGQRAILIKTPYGNVLWDCITLLDDATVQYINDLGGLKAIVISHPHYYSTHVEWARAFKCPVYLGSEDREWTAQTSSHQIFIEDTLTELQIEGQRSGIQILKLGGHFPGALVALYGERLLVADILVTTPAGTGNWNVNALGEGRERPRGMNSYAFMWSIPNMIPLGPGEMERMWRVLKGHDFVSTHGAFMGTDIIGRDTNEMKRRVLESMQIQVRNMGYAEHTLLREEIAK